MLVQEEPHGIPVEEEVEVQEEVPCVHQPGSGCTEGRHDGRRAAGVEEEVPAQPLRLRLREV